MYVPTPKSRMRRTSTAILTRLRRVAARLFPLPRVKRKARSERLHSFANRGNRGFGTDMIQDLGDARRDRPHFRLPEASGRYRGAAEPDAAGVQWWIGIERDRVLIYGDACPIERVFRFFALQSLREDVYQEEMRVGATRHDTEALGL